VFDFELSAEEMGSMDALDKGPRVGPDPNTHPSESHALSETTCGRVRPPREPAGLQPRLRQLSLMSGASGSSKPNGRRRLSSTRSAESSISTPASS
jgi:hypothetical protein